MKRPLLPSLLALVALALVAGCSGKQKVQTIAAPECPGPAWTCFQSGQCPFAEFQDSLCAVGTAESISSYTLGMEAAKTRARREMAAVVRSQVDGFTRACIDSYSKNGSGDDSIQKVGDVAQNVVEESLSGVSVPKTWYNSQAKVYFAIAVLDAKSFGNALKGLREAKGLSAAARAEVDRRAEALASDWRSERDRKNGVSTAQ